MIPLRPAVLAELLIAAPLAASWLNAILLPLSIVTAIGSYLRRKHDVGGWLMYFYFWISALLAVYLKDALSNYRVFLPSSKLEPTRHLALTIAVYPRLLALLGVVAVAFALLKFREWLWIERLRLALAVTLLVAGISVVLDATYFQQSFRANLIRWVVLCLWFLYFCFSVRIKRVFRTKDWNQVATQRVMT